MAELRKVFSPTEENNKPVIVFIHGLAGDIQETWMSNPNDPKTSWPLMIGEDTGCAVWIMGYFAPKSRWTGDAMALPQIASSLLDRLSSEPQLAARELIFIGHSLGGLTIKALLRQAFDQGTQRYVELAEKIKGIILVGAPNFGSSLASILSKIRLVRPNPQMHDLALHNASLAELNQRFRTLVKEKKISVRTYYETQPCRVPVKYLGRLLPGLLIVSPTSAESYISDETAIAVEADHLNICKPNGRNAPIHVSTLDFIRRNFTEPTKTNTSLTPNLDSGDFSAKFPSEITPYEMHLGFANYQDTYDSEKSVSCTVCVTTDSPETMCNQLNDMRASLYRNPLIRKSQLSNIQKMSLLELVHNAATRDETLRQLTTIEFSAYVFFAPLKSLRLLSQEKREFKIFVQPLINRLSKKNEAFLQVHTKIEKINVFINTAAKFVTFKYRRTVPPLEIAKSKFSQIEEMAALIAYASSHRLGETEQPGLENLLDYLKTRIRCSTNLINNTAHTRDKNVLF